MFETNLVLIMRTECLLQAQKTNGSLNTNIIFLNKY